MNVMYFLRVLVGGLRSGQLTGGVGVFDTYVLRCGRISMDSSFLFHTLPFPKVQAVLFTQIISVVMKI